MNKYYFDKENHYHYLNGNHLTGTSSVSDVIAKNLTWWSAELSAVTALESGQHIPTIREEYEEAKKKGKPGIDALQKKYPIFKKARFAHYDEKNRTAEKGTDLHSLYENFIKNGIEDDSIKEFIRWFILYKKCKITRYRITFINKNIKQYYESNRT